jgi:hypothetical protein
MPKLECDCGEVLNLSIVPSPFGFAVIWEQDLEALRESLETAESRRSVWIDAVSSQDAAFRQAYVCPRCGRLHLFWSGSDRRELAVWTLQRGDVSRLLGQGRSPDRSLPR